MERQFLNPPSAIVAGETLRFALRAAAAATSAVAKFAGVGGISVPLLRQDRQWVLAVDTDDWSAGNTAFEIWETLGDGSRVHRGRWPLVVNAPLGEYDDGRTLAAQIVEKIEQMIAGTAGENVKQYSVAGAAGGSRSLVRYSPAELLELLKYWRARLTREEIAAGRRRRPNIRYYL